MAYPMWYPTGGLMVYAMGSCLMGYGMGYPMVYPVGYTLVYTMG